MLNPVTGILIRGHVKTQRHTHREESHVMTEAEVGVRQLRAKEQTPRTAGSHQKLEEARKNSPLESSPLEGIEPNQNLGFRLLAS